MAMAIAMCSPSDMIGTASQKVFKSRRSGSGADPEIRIPKWDFYTHLGIRKFAGAQMVCHG
jgi:hypothetical protein